MLVSINMEVASHSRTETTKHILFFVVVRFKVSVFVPSDCSPLPNSLQPNRSHFLLSSHSIRPSAVAHGVIIHRTSSYAYCNFQAVIAVIGWKVEQ
jgi:hypothetical protein